MLKVGVEQVVQGDLIKDKRQPKESYLENYARNS